MRSIGRSPSRAVSTASGCNASTLRRRSAELQIEGAMSTEIMEPVDTASITERRIDARHARDLILTGHLPAGMRIVGPLDLSGIREPFVLPDGIEVRRLKLRGSTGLAELPRGLRCYELDARQTLLHR